jgi:hypothetical protein
MNLVTALRQQLTAMEAWYRNALIVNVILDYLGEETPDKAANVLKVQDMMTAKRIVAELMGSDTVFFVDRIRVLTIHKTNIDVKVHTKWGEPTKLDMNMSYTIDYTAKHKHEENVAGGVDVKLEGSAEVQDGEYNIDAGGNVTDINTYRSEEGRDSFNAMPHNRDPQ